ncbi:oxidoreductase-like domain-containing protein [Colwellia sp. C1TZA3]|uniref:oxidoreductase-like domain-containing protein n=1 Tax=Colwellia sp. C1TZA3 TaxID=2508879 RepID=UPI0011BA23B8|nr:oxidoreductase-like domain-containing protein [Colwellia sp. C1TZA3]TWX69302.1 hypothetical protein ESZ39_11330 [Colwellia sp. C1TZA3]
MTKLLAKPSPPADDDCCGGGACNPCVWDYYYAERKKWRLQQVTLKATEEQKIQQQKLSVNN